MDRTERFYKIDRLLGGGLSVSFAKLSGTRPSATVEVPASASRTTRRA